MMNDEKKLRVRGSGFGVRGSDGCRMSLIHFLPSILYPRFFIIHQSPQYNPSGPKSMHIWYNLPMPLTCNIDSRGKLARLIYGIVLLLAGLLLAWLWAAGSGSTFRWIVACLCVTGGAIAVFE